MANDGEVVPIEQGCPTCSRGHTLWGLHQAINGATIAYGQSPPAAPCACVGMLPPFPPVALDTHPLCIVILPLPAILCVYSHRHFSLLPPRQ